MAVSGGSGAIALPVFVAKMVDRRGSTGASKADDLPWNGRGRPGPFDSSHGGAGASDAWWRRRRWLVVHRAFARTPNWGRSDAGANAPAPVDAVSGG